MLKKFSSKRSASLISKVRALREYEQEISQPLAAKISAKQDTLVSELEEALENLRQVIEKSEAVVSKISSALAEPE